MNPDKSPGPDGFNPGFYQKYWDIVGGDVVWMVCYFFDTGEFPSHLAATHICLIPKKSKPETMNDLRPIALCNVIYKILSKVLSNRLKEVLPHVISDTQSAFLPGRLITDNIMISFEIMHFLKRKTTGKDGFMAVKLDMSKAYDRVEWSFLRAVLTKMGFADRLVGMIMKCISLVSYSILAGGEEIGPIIPTRGLRQGDPLSPYLFILCAEGLSCLIKNYERCGKIQGCRIARGAPSVSHMLFADDSYLYCKATEAGAINVSELLHIFQLASGQQVNLSKSSIFFSKNTEVNVRRGVCDILGIEEAGDNNTYLGLPSILGRNKSVMLGFLKEKMKQKIQKWEGRYISKSGKEVLLKTVAQALPSYAMNVFLIPLDVCKDLEQLMCKYWWQTSSTSSRGIHWKSWNKLTVHKSKGGMDFRNMRDFNLCLLSKQGWRLQSKPEALVSRIFKARYFKETDFINANLGSSPSFIWRSVYEAQGVVKMGIRRRVGSGMDIDILKDPWLPCESNPKVTTVHPNLVGGKVSSLMMTGEVAWDSDLVRDMFNQRDAELILSITLNSCRIQDMWFWSFERSGQFSVRSTYRHLQKIREEGSSLVASDFWKKLWKLRVPAKVKNVLWRAASNFLPTKTLLRSKHVAVDYLCPFCKDQRETIIHCLVQCQFARACWNQVDVVIERTDTMGFATWLEITLKEAESDKRKTIAMICWALWSVRNDQVWKAKGATVSAVVYLAHSALDNWTKAQDKSSIPAAAMLTDADGGSCWTKPGGTTIKINVDAALFDEVGNFSFACVARDCNGVFIEAISSCKQGTLEPEMAEALGVREALSWIKQKRWENVIVETDSLVVVQSIRSSVVMLSYFGNVIDDCKSMLQVMPDVSLLFVRRSANRVAHWLARASYYVADRIIRSNDVSPELLDVVLQDVS